MSLPIFKHAAESAAIFVAASRDVAVTGVTCIESSWPIGAATISTKQEPGSQGNDRRREAGVVEHDTERNCHRQKPKENG
ncbi:MAG: hypothetical protein FJ388_11375 [Verrucomicrobia bacterium]|nr:hypothetical protein [Verrucomicrobiota bacterium]